MLNPKKKHMTMRTLRLFSLAAVALVMAACSSEDTALEPQSPARQDGRIPFTATIAAPAGDAATRTIFENGTDGDGKPIINVKWKKGDEVALIHNGKKDVVTVDVVNETDGTATISGTIDPTGTDGEAVTVVYPAASVKAGTGATPAADASYALKGFQQDGTLSYIANNIDARQGSGTIKISGEPAEATLDGSVTLTSGIAIWKLSLKDGSGSLSANDVTLKVGGNMIAKAVSATAMSDYYMCVVPATMGTGDFTIEATVSGVTYLYTKTGGVALIAGKYYESEVTMAPVTDLSMVNNAGVARDKQWTANCYMVHTAGIYKLPLVYGNAIKDGAANTAAYTGISNTNTTETFPNHEGNAIDAPWITKSTSGAGVDKGMGITVKSAELLWQDAEGLITAVGISGDYLLLTVGKDAATQQGNALVAAKDASGNIVWSWHIWVTTETFADASLTTVATGSHDYKVTPVNLGWVPTDGKKGYAPYYQWGRKDAFIPSTGSANTNHTVYDINGTTVTGLTYKASTDATIADNIKNPTTHYYNKSTSGPCTTKYYNMWDAQQTGTGNITTATVKTVYDPCPAGFCVPTYNLYYYMGGDGSSRSMTTWDSDNKGATWDNTVVANSITGNALFFPASGYRYFSSGALFDVGSNGSFWSASAYNSYNGHSLYFTSSHWLWNNDYWANGIPVRAVAEE